MPTVPLVARHTFPYAGGTVFEGEAFVAQSAQDAMLLKAIGHAVDAPPEAPHALAEDGADDESDETVSTPKRRRRVKQDV